ncbi:hypothetical protein KCP76_18490 [Salmonella enterica subsp. enterica serovar Weltevreden]|nr:hypothetical protein KCP76_18490 [Salmonella enterica subsp. enterica serovar Weltevreden]
MPVCAQTASVKKYGPGSAGSTSITAVRHVAAACVDYEYRARQPGMKGQVVDLAMYNIRNPQDWQSIPGAALWLHEHGHMAHMKLTSRKKAKLWLAAAIHGASTIVAPKSAGSQR